MITMEKKNTSIRLKELMQERNLKQVDILRMAEPYAKQYDIKFNKSDLSQYVSGKTEPGQDKLFLLGITLNVSETWLMGYDVPRERYNIQTSPFMVQKQTEAQKTDLSYMFSGFEERSHDKKRIFDYETKQLQGILLTAEKSGMSRDRLIRYFEKLTKLDDESFQVVCNMINRLSTYQRLLMPKAAHANDNATPEENKHDDDIMDNDDEWSQ